MLVKLTLDRYAAISNSVPIGNDFFKIESSNWSTTQLWRRPLFDLPRCWARSTNNSTVAKSTVTTSSCENKDIFLVLTSSLAILNKLDNFCEITPFSRSCLLMYKFRSFSNKVSKLFNNYCCVDWFSKIERWVLSKRFVKRNVPNTVTSETGEFLRLNEPVRVSMYKTSDSKKITDICVIKLLSGLRVLR